MEFKVKALDGVEEKSVQEVEIELLNKHEESIKEEPVVIKEEMDDDKVLSYIKTRYNKEINSVNDLIAEREVSDPIPEDIAVYMRYKKETGRGMGDFMQLNKDYDNVDSESLIKDYLLATEEGLDVDDIDSMMDDYRYDEDYDEDSKIRKVKSDTKKILAKAKKHFNDQKESYKIPLESSVGNGSLEGNEEFEAYKQFTKQAKTEGEENERKRNWFNQKTDDVFNNDFKGFDFNFNDKKFVFSPSDAAELKKTQATPMTFINKFLDESGLMKDAAGYHKSLAMAMHPEKFAKFFYEQGLSDATEDVIRKTKNINMSERTIQNFQGNSGEMQVRAVNQDSGRGLKIRNIK